MSFFRQYLNIFTISLALVAIACSHVQANPFACAQTQINAISARSYAGTASGELKVDEKVMSLTRAYAITTDRVWDDFKYLPANQPSQTGWAVLLTEQDITDDVFREFLLDQSVSTQRILAGDVRGVLINLRDPAGYTIKFLYPPPPGWGFSTFTASATAGNIQITGNEITGALADSPPLIQNFAYRLLFKASIPTPPFTTKVFAGTAAFDTPPVRVYLAYADALQHKNLVQMRRHLTIERANGLDKLVAEMGTDKLFAELDAYIRLSRDATQNQNYQPVESLLSRLGKERFTALSALAVSLNQLPSDRATWKQYLHKLVIRGDTSKLVLKTNPQETEVTSAVTLSLTCENGSWKF